MRLDSLKTAFLKMSPRTFRVKNSLVNGRTVVNKNWNMTKRIWGEMSALCDASFCCCRKILKSLVAGALLSDGVVAFPDVLRFDLFETCCCSSTALSAVVAESSFDVGCGEPMDGLRP